MTDKAMVDEFDSVAEWTAEAVLRLGHEQHAVPAACRGSGSPTALDWLVAQCGLSPDTLLVDVGAGVGGPAEYAARASGARSVLVEPMLGACRAAARLFDRPVVAADGAALPLADARFDVAWSLGVLCTVEDKGPHVEELVRVVAPGGCVGLLVYERAADELAEQPDGNHFPSHGEVLALLDDAGLAVHSSTLVVDFPPSPDDWQEAVARVDADLAEHHGDDPAWQDAEDQQQVIGSLIERRLVVGRLLVAHRATA